MKKVFLSIIGILFLSCSFYDETKALSFHSDCYLAFKGWLKEGGSEKLNQAFIETVDGKSIYRFDFSEEAALSGKKTAYSGSIKLSFWNNEKGKQRMEYFAEMTTSVEAKTQSMVETEELISVCTVNQAGTILEGFAQVRRSAASTTIGYTNIANLEGYLILLPIPDDYNVIRQKN